MARSTEPGYSSTFRGEKGAATAAMLSKCQKQLKAANTTIAGLNATVHELATTIQVMRITLRNALQGGRAAEAAAVAYTVASELHEDDYRRACKEGEKRRTEGSAGAAASERAARDAGHAYVAILTNQALSQQPPEAGFAKAEKVMSEILEKERWLIQQGRLDKSGIQNSQRQYCFILWQLASFEKPKNKKAADERLKCAEMVHRSIWERTDEAQSLRHNDEWVLDNGYGLGLVLAELKTTGEDQYRLAEIQFNKVWKANKRAPARGPTHDATVESALQWVSMLEKQTKLDEQQKRADIEDRLREIWSLRGTRLTAGLLRCGDKLGEQLHQQKKYPEAQNVLHEVWMARQGAVEYGEEGNNARSTGYLLADALYYQRTREKYEQAKVILLKLWERRLYYASPKASPSNDFIGWRLAWTFLRLEDNQRAEQIFHAVWESRRKSWGADDAQTLFAQYQLAFTQTLRKQWAAAQHNFQFVWETRKLKTDGELDWLNTIRISSGHHLGICLSEQKSYGPAVLVLTEVYSWSVVVLGGDADETRATLMKLEEVKRARAVQTEEKKKTSAERAGIEARQKTENQERKPVTKLRATKR
jgi:hypothetical protein